MPNVWFDIAHFAPRKLDVARVLHDEIVGRQSICKVRPPIHLAAKKGVEELTSVRDMFTV